MYKKAEYQVIPGTVIQGKWHQKNYTVIREIGKGTIGNVYLCKVKGKHVALKLSHMPMSISREVAVLRRLNKVRDQHLGPFLFDVDDWEKPNGDLYVFYVMEYLQGMPLATYIKRKGADPVGDILIKLLKQLELLHLQGFVFGDLKQEHIRIVSPHEKIRFLDVGGMTKMGQSVKEYSNFYDRAYWQLGTRKAEPSYDLFAVVMIFVSVYYPKQFKRTKHAKAHIIKHIEKHPVLRKYQRPFQRALTNDYPTASRMRQDVEKVVQHQQQRKKKEKLIPQAMIISAISGLYYFISWYYF